MFSILILMTALERHTNLALLQQYGPNAWRIHNYLTEATAKNIEKALEDLNKLMTEVNRDRKNSQVRVSSMLTGSLRNSSPNVTDTDRKPTYVTRNAMDRADF